MRPRFRAVSEWIPKGLLLLGMLMAMGVEVLRGASLTNHLAQLFHFDGQIQNAREPGRELLTTVEGNVAFVAGKVGDAYRMGGHPTVDSRVTITNLSQSVLGGPSGYSLACWMRHDSGNGLWLLALAGLGGSGTNLCALGAGIVNGQGVPVAVVGPDAAKVGTSKFISWPDGSWHHIALTLGGGIARLYVDGAEYYSASGIASGPEVPLQAVLFGQDSDATFTTAAKLTLDELAFWNRPLSPEDVRAVYQAGADGQDFASLVPPPTPVGDLDMTFDPGAGADVGPVRVIEYQPDGRMLVGGRFRSFDGYSRNGLARLNLDGTVDELFVPGVTFDSNDTIEAIAVQPDGRLLVVGDFRQSAPGAGTVVGIVRLMPDGAIDPTFRPPQLYDRYGSDAVLKTVAVQPDGRILIGGDIGRAGSTPVSHLVRLRSDGTLDTRFAPSIVPRDIVMPIRCVRVTSRGIYVFGAFKEVNGKRRWSHARLDFSGSLDLTYNAAGGGPEVPSVFGGNTSGDVRRAVFLPDGGIVLGGVFYTVNGLTRRSLAKFDADGVFDDSFDPGFVARPGYDVEIRDMMRTSTGHLLVGGDFDSVGGRQLGRLVRLQSNGTVDRAFSPEVAESVSAVAERCDGVLAAGGDLAFVKGVRRRSVAQFHPADPEIARMALPRQTPAGTVVGSYVVPGRLYSFEASDDLRMWVPLNSTKSTVNLRFWVDPASNPGRHRFFRVVQK